MKRTRQKRTPQDRPLRIGGAKGQTNAWHFLAEADALRERAPELLGPQTIDRLHLTYIAELLEAAGRHFQRIEDAEAEA